MVDSLVLIYLPEPFLFFSKCGKLWLGLGFCTFFLPFRMMTWSFSVSKSLIYFLPLPAISHLTLISLPWGGEHYGEQQEPYFSSVFHGWLMRFLKKEFKARGLTRKFRDCEVPLLWTFMTTYKSQVVGLWSIIPISVQKLYPKYTEKNGNYRI